MFRINHAAHLLRLESIFIKAVPKAALILADQSQTNLRRAFGPALAVFGETVDAEARTKRMKRRARSSSLASWRWVASDGLPLHFCVSLMKIGQDSEAGARRSPPCDSGGGGG